MRNVYIVHKHSVPYTPSLDTVIGYFSSKERAVQAVFSHPSFPKCAMTRREFIEDLCGGTISDFFIIKVRPINKLYQ